MLVWALLPLIVLAGLGTKVYWDLEYQRTWSQYQQAGQRFNAAIKRHSDLTNHAQGRDFNGLNADEVEAMLKASHGIEFKKPLMINPNSPQHKMGVYIDPLSNTRVEVYFFIANNKYAGSGAMMQNFPRQPSQPTHAAGQQWASKLGRWMCPVLNGIFTPLPYIVWLPLLLVYILMPGRRKWLSFALVNVVVIVPLIWLMASFSLLEVKGVMSYDANLWGLIMFVVTAIAVFNGGMRNRFDDPMACKQCGYSLVGNQSGTCPECGRAISGKQAALPN